jgi:hypothetical protein
MLSAFAQAGNCGFRSGFAGVRPAAGGSANLLPPRTIAGEQLPQPRKLVVTVEVDRDPPTALGGLSQVHFRA